MEKTERDRLETENIASSLSQKCSLLKKEGSKKEQFSQAAQERDMKLHGQLRPLVPFFVPGEETSDGDLKINDTLRVPQETSFKVAAEPKEVIVRTWDKEQGFFEESVHRVTESNREPMTEEKEGLKNVKVFWPELQQRNSFLALTLVALLKGRMQSERAALIFRSKEKGVKRKHSGSPKSPYNEIMRNSNKLEDSEKGRRAADKEYRAPEKHNQKSSRKIKKAYSEEGIVIGGFSVNFKCLLIICLTVSLASFANFLCSLCVKGVKRKTLHLWKPDFASKVKTQQPRYERT
ncbi:hypothetical protein Gasu2_65770 [Galdieria sulphuraria]|nr:hypothetical protein Gasu2_65770 [Galdieria sulphuraria]